MLIYNYKCDCGALWQRGHEAGTGSHLYDKCPQCRCKTSWKSVTQGEAKRETNTGDVVRVSRAMGISVDQIPERLKQFPDETYDSRGYLVTRSLSEHKKMLRRNGMTDFNSFN